MRKKNPNTGIFILLLFMIPLAGAGVDIHVPSLPSIIQYFHASQSAVQMSITLYLLGYGAGQMFVGTLSDSFGRRPLLLLGAFIYILSCIASILATSIEFFLLSRFIQGLAISGPSIAAKASLSDSFRGKDLQKKSTYVGISWAAGPILAPVIGGYLEHYLGWHSCFYFLSIYTVLLFALCCLFFPETKADKEPFQVQTIKQNYIQVIKHPVFIGSVICSGITYSLMGVFNVMAPFIIQTSLHYSSIVFGHMAFILGIAWFTGGFINRIFLNYYDSSSILFFSLIFLTLFLIAMTFIESILPFKLAFFVSSLLPIYIIGGILLPSSFAISLSIFPKLGGTVNAISGLGMMTLTSIVTFIASQFGTLTQMPLFYIYLSMSVLAFLVNLTLMRKKKYAR